MLKYMLCSAVLVAFSALPLYASETGQPAPAFDVKDIDGKDESLAQYKGKIVVLEWNNPQCPFVKKHYGSHNMQDLQQWALDKGVIWLSINSGAPGKEGYMDADAAKTEIAKVGAHETAYIIDADGSLGKLYGAKATPHMFVVDEQGNLAYAGAIDNQPTADPADIKTADNYVKDAVSSLLTGKQIAVAQTRAYGCSVKYKD